MDELTTVLVNIVQAVRANDLARMHAQLDTLDANGLHLLRRHLRLIDGAAEEALQELREGRRDAARPA